MPSSGTSKIRCLVNISPCSCLWNDTFVPMQTNSLCRVQSPISSHIFSKFSRYKILPVFLLHYRNGTLEYLNKWLARVYELTTKFYTIKKFSSQMGTFTFYAAIDVNLDESKDDVHVVINSDNLYRPDIIFRFIDDCFQERKVRDFDFSIRNCVVVTQPIDWVLLLLLV